MNVVVIIASTMALLGVTACANGGVPSERGIAIRDNAVPPTSREAANNAVRHYLLKRDKIPTTEDYVFDAPMRSHVQHWFRMYGWIVCGRLKQNWFLAYFNPDDPSEVFFVSRDRLLDTQTRQACARAQLNAVEQLP